MSEIKVNEKAVVVPGEIIATGMDYLPGKGTYRQNENIIANTLGLIRLEGKVVKLIPLSGKYFPKRNDVIIGKVTDIMSSGWRIDINSMYTAALMLKDASSEYIRKGADLTKYYNFGDYVVVRVENLIPPNLIDLSMRGPGLRKLGEGRILKVTPNKVPRIIGKMGSMINTIKDATKCMITVGQNGVVWISGEPAQEALAEKTIKKIEKESHISGLTERIKEFLEKNKVK